MRGKDSEDAGLRRLKESLEHLYLRYNHRRFVHPDPLEFLYGYGSPRDREVAGFVASALAYGRVRQIISSVSRVLGVMGPSPRDYLLGSSPGSLREAFASFRHRFTTGAELAVSLAGLKGVIERYGSLEECFAAGLDGGQETVTGALSSFCDEVRSAAGEELSFVLPSPTGGSACKRLNLFLRWMVRRDEVDPGDWDVVSPSVLVVPLDTHMFAVGRALGFTERKRADLKAALEVTAGFRRIEPADPVRYDFALTRPGIRSEAHRAAFLESIPRWNH